MFQKGRSRTWLGDHGWWLDVVEFQPTDGGRGSYSNVSCMWLWNVKTSISFDVGSVREEALHRFENEDQFERVAEFLAGKARERVLHYRSLFPSIEAVSDYHRSYLSQDDRVAGWPCFNAAIAHGLCGRIEDALHAFSRSFVDVDSSIEWQRKAHEDTRYLETIVRNADLFRQTIADRIARTRALQKHPPVNIDFDSSALLARR